MTCDTLTRSLREAQPHALSRVRGRGFLAPSPAGAGEGWGEGSYHRKQRCAALPVCSKGRSEMENRAAVVRKAGLPRPYKQSQPVTIEEVELAPPGPGEVLVKIRAAGVCHSDLSVVTGDVPLP